MLKVGIIGHYGYGLDLANGQTIKTKIITEYLNNVLNGECTTIDAHGGIKAVIPVIRGSIKCLKNCENVIILLTENGLRVAVPVLALLNRKYHKKLHYVVIGGWLPKFLEKHPIIEKQLKLFTCIYVETSTMKTRLEKKGFSNIVVMPNCKKLDIVDCSELNKSYREPFPICTFSRVMKEKGIETIINVVKSINYNAKRTVYRLDIYGQVDPAQREWFDKLKKDFPSYINYGDVIPFDKSVTVLKNYFLLVFPTHFYTEGIPGTIIDAYAAGLPVISAKWESFSDVVEEGSTGYGYTFGNVQELEAILNSAANEPKNIISMKEKCLNKAIDYTLESALNELIVRL